MTRLRKLESLIAEMLDAIRQLGECPSARIDARQWFKHFRRKAANLKIKTKKAQ